MSVHRPAAPSLRAAPIAGLLASLVGLASPGCGREAAPTGTDRPADAVKLTVAPLELAGIGYACYDLEIQNDLGEVVWSGGTSSPEGAAPAICSDRYGSGAGGDVTYIAPCDATDSVDTDAGLAMNKAIVRLDGLYDAAGQDLGGYQNPCPWPTGCALDFACVENADTLVEFNLTIMRDAGQGFFDVAVTFEDIFCSAKLDCVDTETGGDIELLHRPGGARDTTVVMALACTSGEGETTFLHMSDVAVVCGTAPNQRTYWLNPAAGLGNTGAVDPIFFQTGVYQGAEQLVPYDKCYWNMAFGVNEGPLAADCRIIASATASAQSWVDQDGETPPNTVYPFISYDAQLTGPDGQVMCGSNPLNGQGSSVQTRYTDIGGGRFARELQCGGTPIRPTGLACNGTIGGDGVVFADAPLGVSVAFGPTVAGPAIPDCAYAPHDPSCRSPLYLLPGGTHLGSCCANACCGDF